MTGVCVRHFITSCTLRVLATFFQSINFDVLQKKAKDNCRCVLVIFLLLKSAVIRKRKWDFKEHKNFLHVEINWNIL